MLENTTRAQFSVTWLIMSTLYFSQHFHVKKMEDKPHKKAQTDQHCWCKMPNSPWFQNLDIISIQTLKPGNVWHSRLIIYMSCTYAVWLYWRSAFGIFKQMDFLFGRRKSPEEMLRQNQRALNRAMRDLDRERMKLEQQEKKIIADIKKMAKQGQMVRWRKRELVFMMRG